MERVSTTSVLPTVESRARATIAAERLASPRRLRSAGHIALTWALYGALSWAALTTPWWSVKIVAWLVMGWLMVSNGAIAHEALHGHLTRSPLVARAVGVVAGTSFLLPYSTYKAFHITHHQHTASELDPEGIPARLPSRAIYPLVFTGGLAFVAELSWYGLRTIAGRAPRWVRNPRQRREVVVDSVIVWIALAALVVGFVTIPGVIVTVWLVPWLVAVGVLFPMILSPEHYGADNPPISVLGTTRTISSNRFVQWAYWNINFHTAHHLSPAVVHQNVPRVHEMLEREMGATWKHSGYLRYHVALFRSLPWRAQRDG